MQLLKLKYLIKSSFKFINSLLFFRIITRGDIGSARVKKRHPIKNTAMLLITKTINENKLKDKQFQLETKFDTDK